MARAILINTRVNAGVWRDEVRLKVTRPDSGLNIGVQLRPNETSKLIRDLVESLAFLDHKFAADTLASAVDILTGVTSVTQKDTTSNERC
ncbi:hypothetical protein [Gordonia terrae]